MSGAAGMSQASTVQADANMKQVYQEVGLGCL
jgi:hypothetical protein